jgi:hypothetical protein
VNTHRILVGKPLVKQSLGRLRNTQKDISKMTLRDSEGVSPCSFVEIDRRFRVAYCLHHQGDE